MHTPLTDAIEGSRPARGPLGARIVLGLLRGYKILLSPLFTGSCRFQPSCADYMTEAVTIHGVRRGVWLGIVRLTRCRPFGGHGYDPVPRS
jgi:putative membrane protein insertion efficiency factor